MVERRRDVYIHTQQCTKYDLFEKIENVMKNGNGNGLFNAIDMLYRDFVEYIAGHNSSQFTHENENINLAKDILRVTTDARFKTVVNGFKLVDKFSFEEEETQCQKE